MPISRRLEIFIFIFFVLITIILTYPLILNLNHSIFSDPEWTFDSLGSLYGIWWWKFAWKNGFRIGFNHLIAHPFGNDSSHLPAQPGIPYPLLLLSLIGNEFLAYNIFILISYILSAVFTFYLVYYLTRNKLGSMVSGIIFSFCQNHSLHAFSHLGLAVIQWMPLFILTLVVLNEKVNYKYAVLCASTFSLVTLSNYYYGYFMLIFAACFIIYKIIFIFRYNHAKINKSILLKIIKIAAVITLVITAFMLPFALSTIQNAFGKERQIETTSNVYKRPYNDLFKYSARVYDYILPSEYHPIFGKFTLGIVKKITGGQRHWSERTLYLGITPIFLAIVAVLGWKRKPKPSPIKDKEDFYIPLFLFTGAAAFYCSLAPVVKLWAIKVPTPSFLLYNIAPMFRVYARMGFVVTLCMAILAGYGLKYILLKFRTNVAKTTVALTFSILIFLEYTVIPPFRNVDFSKTPAVYKWLSFLPENTVIAEYPLVHSIDEKNYRYLFYQRIHKKRMINGAREGTLADDLRKSIRDIKNPLTSQILRYLSVDYVIVHKDDYDNKDIEEISNTPGLAPAREFPTTMVYKITADPPNLIQVQRNFHKTEIWNDRKIWQWTMNNAEFWLNNTTNKNLYICISFRTVSFSKKRKLDIFLNDKLLKRITIPPISNLTYAKRVYLDNLTLPPGENTIRFYTPEGPQKIDDVLMNGDMRIVSIAFSGIQIKEKD